MTSKTPAPQPPRVDVPTRREAIVRVGAAVGAIVATAAVARWRWDKGGFGEHHAEGERLVRDFRIKDDPGPLDMAIVRHGTPEQLVERALEAMGGMKRFVSRGDVVAIKPNIGWDRTPLHAAT